ncbi:sterol desaturase family protein [Ralstonia sp. UBA689]|uniref:sterol desaturase family protein n=1 Tax=Ralstonia sp. UBA689 TaxID=1947373 RepID=UPI0025FE5B56|nr:sterol desaturase family protein [Ralstonia sp. UBA689]
MTPANGAAGASSFDPGLILLAFAPVFLLTIGAEVWYWRKRDPSVYSLKDTASNACLALMHQASDAFFLWLMVKTVYAWTYSHGLRAVPETWWSFALLLLLQDFLYYFFHRASHRVRWMWASHVTHHSSEGMNFSTAFRQSLTYPISGMWLFWIPLAWIGFTPDWVILAVGLNLAFQFFVHTRLGALDSRYAGFWRWLGQYVNTPSVHRVHHAKNPQYIDRNYAGVLTIWDRMFGSFVPEEEAPTFGITRQVRTHNPITLTFHEWRDMWADVFRDRDIRYLWKPPEWRSPRSTVTTEPSSVGSPF